LLLVEVQVEVLTDKTVLTVAEAVVLEVLFMLLLIQLLQVEQFQLQ
jgi:hypothetical protein